MCNITSKLSWFILYGISVYLVCSFVSCGNADMNVGKRLQHGVPVPHPLPIPQPDKLYSTAGDKDPGSVIVVGLDECVNGEGKIIIRNKMEQVVVQASAEGSFVALINAQGGDQLSIQYEDSEATLYLVPLKVPNIIPPLIPHAISGVSPIERIDQSKVLVRGKAQAKSIVGINVTQGIVMSALTDEEDMTFSLEITATPDDHLLIYNEKRPLEEAWSLITP
jgi:hypothetical protein